MRRIPSWLMVIVGVVLVALGGMALAAQDKYTVQVPGGLAFSEFRGYEDWPVVAVSQPEGPRQAQRDRRQSRDDRRLPGRHSRQRQAFPRRLQDREDRWKPKQNAEAPFAVKVPDTLAGVGFMVKDSKRFPDTGGWGYAQFDYDPASDTFTPNTSLQENDAKCGVACHTIVEAKDYVFTAYGKR